VAFNNLLNLITYWFKQANTNQLGNEYNAKQIPNKKNSPVDEFKNAKMPTSG
jgi:hypothetical protein